MINDDAPEYRPRADNPNAPRGLITPVDDLRPCRVPPVGWRCTRGGGHPGPCAAVEVPILWNHDPDAPHLTPPYTVEDLCRWFGVPREVMTPPGSQVAPDMALPSKTPEEHDRDALRRLDGAQWVRLETVDGKVTWLPASPEDQALLDAFRAARNGPPSELLAAWTKATEYRPGDVVSAPRKTRPSLLKRIWAWLTT